MDESELTASAGLTSIDPVRNGIDVLIDDNFRSFRDMRLALTTFGGW